MTPERITAAVCAAFLVPEHQLFGGRKHTAVAHARKYLAYALHLHAGWDDKRIEKHMGRARSWGSWAIYATPEHAEVDRAFARKCQKAEALMKETA